jgi:low temperature requirement protein LtrA
MSGLAAEQTEQRQWITRMVPRSPTEQHRAATPLELFFDLVFVVAVAQAGVALHHGLAEAHVLESIISYAIVFFAIWWAWMNFTWFASAYDCDDVPYRILVFLQLTSALVMAAGVQLAFETGDFSVPISGYVIMRLAMVMQWLRAARADLPRRQTALRYAAGISVLQIAWIALLFAPASWWLVGVILLALAELAVPAWAERAAATPWHPGHIIERYGLFTIIVLGESILAASLGIQSAVAPGAISLDLILNILGGLLIIFCLWWIYFDRPLFRLSGLSRWAFLWGYGHLFIFAAAAAVGAGLAVEFDQSAHQTELGQFGAGMAVAAPVALYLLVLWILHTRSPGLTRLQIWLIPITAGLILLTPFSNGRAAPLTGLLLVAALVVKYTDRYRRMDPGRGHRVDSA